MPSDAERKLRESLEPELSEDHACPQLGPTSIRNRVTRAPSIRRGSPPVSLTHALSLHARLVARDERALAELIEVATPWLLGVAEGLLSDRAEAEEVVQEVFTVVWNGIGQVRNEPPGLPSPGCSRSPGIARSTDCAHAGHRGNRCNELGLTLRSDTADPPTLASRSRRRNEHAGLLARRLPRRSASAVGRARVFLQHAGAQATAVTEGRAKPRLLARRTRSSTRPVP